MGKGRLQCPALGEGWWAGGAEEKGGGLCKRLGGAGAGAGAAGDSSPGDSVAGQRGRVAESLVFTVLSIASQKTWARDFFLKTRCIDGKDPKCRRLEQYPVGVSLPHRPSQEASRGWGRPPGDCPGLSCTDIRSGKIIANHITCI